MLSRWEIQEAPTSADPRRKTLLVKASLDDVHGVIRRLGAACGRPKKERGGPFNFSLSLHGIDSGALSEVEDVLRELSGGAKAAAEPITVSLEVPEMESPASFLSSDLPIELAAASGADFSFAPVEIPREPKSVEIAATPPVPVEDAGPFSGQGEPPVRLPEQEPAGLNGFDAALCGALLASDESMTLDSFQVGSFNRSAHAGATATLTSPGTLYQPLFVFGPPGSGKTHLLHALAEQFARQDPSEPVLLTSGSRLSRAALVAARSGRFSEFEAFADSAKALIVDDLHMLGVSSENEAQLAALFARFSSQRKQIVLASAYPSAAIAEIEASIGVRISSGHAVELKVPTGDKLAEVLRLGLERIGVKANPSESASISRRMGSELKLVLRRLLTVNRLAEAAGRTFSIEEMESMLFDEEPGGPRVTPADELESKLKGIGTVAGNGSAPLLLFYPSSQETHAEWILASTAAAAQGAGWEWPFAAPQRKIYSIDNPAAAPYLIAEECLQSQARAALVLGAPPGSELAARESECRGVLDHLLSDAGIAGSIISYQRSHDAKSHLRAFLDLGPDRFLGGNR